MSGAKHTPGQWFTHREGRSTVYVECRIGGGLIQEVAACGPTAAGGEQQEANARLIAAAPDILEALQITRGNIASLGPAGALTPYTSYQEWLAMVDAVIAKATGQP